MFHKMRIYQLNSIQNFQKILLFVISEIGEKVFSNSSIEEIKIPKNVSIIMDYAFSDCKKLQNVCFFENSELKIIGKYAFSYSAIESICIPSHVEEIRKHAFDNCQKLQTIEFLEIYHIFRYQNILNFSSGKSHPSY